MQFCVIWGLVYFIMELFSRRRSRMYRSKCVSCCVYGKLPKNYAAHEPHLFDFWAYLFVHLLIGTKELHDFTNWADGSVPTYPSPKTVGMLV